MEGAEAQSSATIVVPNWIDGKEEQGSSTFDVITPHDNKPCWKAAGTSIEDAVRAIESSQTAFRSWSSTKPAIRTKILLRAADILETKAEYYAGFMATEMGAEQGVAQFFVVPLAVAMLRDIAGRVSTICGTVPVCQGEGTSAMIYKEPYGVVLGIVPWNAPYVFGVRAAATAIATGNTTILKSSEMTPRCYWALGKILFEAGVPEGVINILHSPPKDNPRLITTMIQHPAIKKVNFTGSANVGRSIAAECGRNLKPCLLELGGKNSAIILPDADMQKAAQECLAGSFLNSGQICMATDRIIVHSSIAATFLQALKSGLGAMAASSTTPPKVVSAASKKRLDSVVSDAVSHGAQVLAGGSLNDGGSDGSNGPAASIFAPTILADVADEMQVWRDETFGPIAAYRVVETENEAIEAANNTGYGLSAAVFTKDLRKGLAVAKRLETGAVHINSMTIHDEPALPFGGVKNSGWGRFNSAAGMEEFVQTKSVTWDE